MKNVEKKCDICGKISMENTTLMNDFSTGEELISSTIKGLAKSTKGLKMDLCSKHHLEFLENTRRWVYKETSLDEYMPKVEQPTT